MNQCTAPGSTSQSRGAGERCVFRRCQEFFRRRKNPAGVQSKNSRDTRPGRPNTAVQAASDKLKTPAQPSRTGSTALPWCMTPAGCLEENSTSSRSISLWREPQLIGLVSSSITQKGEHRSPSRQIPSFLIGSDGIQRSHPRHSPSHSPLKYPQETVMGIGYHAYSVPGRERFPAPAVCPIRDGNSCADAARKARPPPPAPGSPPRDPTHSKARPPAGLP